MKKIILFVGIIIIAGCENDVVSSANESPSWEVIINNYGAGISCGGSVMNYNDQVYRSYNGGISPLNESLDLNESEKIGNYSQSQIYHVEIINDNIWFALSNYNNPGEIKVVDSNGSEISSYLVGINPGDFAVHTSWTFIANEGNYGSSNGSISMINEFGDVYETEAIGDVVQSLEVYGDKLIVLVNNSHKIKIYDITPEGISMPGIEISTGNSSPRELVVLNDKVYFTNWNTQDVKVFNLFNYMIEESISIDGLPEDIMFDGTDLWVTTTMDSQWSPGNTISRIDVDLNSVIETIEVGPGPQNVVHHNDEIYISRTFYDENWNAYHGSSKISSID